MRDTIAAEETVRRFYDLKLGLTEMNLCLPKNVQNPMTLQMCVCKNVGYLAVTGIVYFRRIRKMPLVHNTAGCSLTVLPFGELPVRLRLMRTSLLLSGNGP